MQLYQIGKCNDCGACCMLRADDMTEHICPYYTIKSNQHCTLFGSKKRPRECAEFPRGPADLERVAKWCSIKFVDEKGVTVDGMMDKRVKLTPLT